MVFLFLSFQGFSQRTILGDEQQQAVITTNAVDSNLGCNPIVVPPEFDTDVKCDIFVTTNGPQNAGGFDCSFSQTWTAYLVKNCGYTATPVSITYTWTEDNLPPKVNCSAIPGGDLGCNPESIPSGESLIDFITVDDNCFGAADNSVVFVDETILDDEGCERSVTYIFKATDPCGNTSYDFEACSVTYTWTFDDEAPVISLNPDSSESGDLGCNAELVPPMFEATDNCGVGEPIVTTAGPTNDGCAYS
ncbi:hypothetical protein, partial [Hanstruepera ponticola]|uniref:hypothetical protein n=1 Tax=Hanstruepera ponticola TaxID=2042995 RepID=UPI00178355D1